MLKWEDYILADEGVLMGKPVVKGTRISIAFILEKLADGWTEQDLLDNYPRLTKDHLRAVYAYAYECLKDGLLFPAGIKA